MRTKKQAFPADSSAALAWTAERLSGKLLSFFPLLWYNRQKTAAGAFRRERTEMRMERGVLAQKHNRATLRILGRCGRFTARELAQAAQLAEAWGDGTVTATSRGTLEVNGIPAERAEEAVADCRLRGLRLGGTGRTVRAVQSCKGPDCTRSLTDPHRVACRLEDAFLGRPVPKKFKIGVFGCPNSTGKARSQDVGILPDLRRPGRFRLYVGGMMGRAPRLGEPLPLSLPEEALIPAVERVLALYRAEAEDGERLGALLARRPELTARLAAELEPLE